MRAIAIGGLLRGEAKACGAVLSAGAGKAPRAPPTKALHFTALLHAAASHLFCHVPDEEPYRSNSGEAFAGNVLLGPDILCARVDAT